jgi:hypothetical protein
MDIFSTFINIVSSFVNFFSNVDMFAATHNIKLGVIVALFLVEFIMTIVFMLAIKRGFLVGHSLWFIFTFILVVITCIYVVACVLYTASPANIWGYLSGINPSY